MWVHFPIWCGSVSEVKGERCALTVNRATLGHSVCTQTNTHTRSLVYLRAHLLIYSLWRLKRLKFIWKLKLWYNFNDRLFRSFVSYFFSSLSFRFGCIKIASVSLDIECHIKQTFESTHIEQILNAFFHAQRRKKMCHYIARGSGNIEDKGNG